MNDARCPECARVIRVNMSRHLRLSHTAHVCYWRCPVPSCPLWFMSELNGKDHIENIHHSRVTLSMSASEHLASNSLAAGNFSPKRVQPVRRCGRILPWRGTLDRSYIILIQLQGARIFRLFGVSLSQWSRSYSHVMTP